MNKNPSNLKALNYNYSKLEIMNFFKHQSIFFWQLFYFYFWV